MSAQRLKSYFVLAAGLAALGCGGQQSQKASTQNPTAGAETAPSAMATEQPTAPPAPQPTVVSDVEVRAFVDALIQLAILEQEGTERVENGEAPKRVEADLRARMGQVFAANPLTPQRFAEIADQLEDDEILRRRVEDQLQRRMAAA